MELPFRFRKHVQSITISSHYEPCFFLRCWRIKVRQPITTHHCLLPTSIDVCISFSLNKLREMDMINGHLISCYCIMCTPDYIVLDVVDIIGILSPKKLALNTLGVWPMIVCNPGSKSNALINAIVFCINFYYIWICSDIGTIHMGVGISNTEYSNESYRWRDRYQIKCDDSNCHWDIL